MKLYLIVDKSGNVIAAMKSSGELTASGIHAAIRPCSPDHRLYELVVPERLEGSSIREIVRQVRKHSDGSAPEFPE